MGFEEVVESRIQEAIAQGAFDNLKGAGEPLRLSNGEQLAGDNWLGFKILQNGGMLPEWLLLAKEIEDDERRLRAIDERHQQIVRLAAEEGDWARYVRSIRHYRAAFAEAAAALRRKQDSFNQKAPGILTERPGIWVDYHLERLDQRLRAAGAPEDVVTSSL